MTSTNFALAGTQVEAQTYRASRKDAITAKRANVQVGCNFIKHNINSTLQSTKARFYHGCRLEQHSLVLACLQ